MKKQLFSLFVMIVVSVGLVPALTEATKSGWKKGGNASKAARDRGFTDNVDFGIYTIAIERAKKNKAARNAAWPDQQEEWEQEQDEQGSVEQESVVGDDDEAEKSPDVE